MSSDVSDCGCWSPLSWKPEVCTCHLVPVCQPLSGQREPTAAELAFSKMAAKGEPGLLPFQLLPPCYSDKLMEETEGID